MSTRATLLALLVLLAVGAGGALWFVAGGEREAVPAGAAAAPAAESPGAAAAGAIDLAAVPAAGRDAPLAAAVQSGLAPLGVRVPGAGRLSGTVVERISGRPLGGARVELHAFLPSGGPLLKRVLPLFGGQAQPYVGTGEPLAVVAADGVGSFAFEGVRSGSWYVQARGEREVPDGVASARVSASGDGGPLEVFVRPGGRVVGTVFAPDGDPAAGARVLLLPGVDHLLESLRAGDLCALETATAGDGRFVLAGVPPGPSYDLFAEGRGFPVSFVTGIAVAAGQDTEVTLQTRPGGSLAGRVLSVGDPEQPRAPLAGAHVAVVPHGLRYLPFAAAVLASTHGVSDAEGNFVLRDVPAGEVDLIGIAAGHAPTIGPTLFVSEAARAAAPDFELPVGLSVSGRVVDGAGAPLAGVRVTWNPVDLSLLGLGGSFGPLVARALEGLEFPVTGADGRFTAGAFPGEPPYRIEFDKAGHAHRTHAWDPSTEDELEIVLEVGGFVEGIVMDVEGAAPVTSFFVKSDALIKAPGELLFDGELGAGMLVEDEGGRFRIGPLRPGEVSLEVDAPDHSMTRVSRLQVASGETLRGVIVELHPGQRVRGRVIDDAGLPVAGAILVPAYTGPATLPEAEGEGAVQQRGRPDSDAPSGLTAYIAQLGLSGPGTARSNADGSFELRGVEAGTLRIAAVHRDHATSWSETFEVFEDGGAVEVLIEMARGGAIFGQVVDRFARPVAGAIVIAAAPNQMDPDEPRGGEALCQGRTDVEGHYRIERVGPGTYFLVLTRGDEALNPMSFLGTLNFDMVTVPEGKQVEYDIVDSSIGGTRVFGRVTARGAPLDSGQVTALGFESDSMLGFDVKIARIRDGSYEFEGLAPGEYQLNVQAPGTSGEGRMTIEVPDVPEYQLDLALPEGRIAGRVLDASTREPISGAWVVAESSLAIEPEGILGSVIGREAGLVRDWSDEDGEFALEGLQEAEYEVSVRTGFGQGYVLEQPLVIDLGYNQSRDDLEILLKPALSLRGVVTDADGLPLEDARVSAWIEDRMETLQMGSSGEEGRFELEGLRPGTYVVRVTHAGHAGQRLGAVELGADSEELEVALEPGIPVSVLVLGTRGQPVSGAAARLVEAEADADPADVERVFQGLFEGRGVTDANGLMELGHFAPGSYRLEAQRGASRAAELVTLVPGSAGVQLSLRLR